MVAFGVVTFDEAKRGIVFETARREGVEVSFFEYLRIGLPLTILIPLVARIWL